MKKKSLLISALSILFCIGFTSINAQQNNENAQALEPFDITGNWVSIITEDWRYRILTAGRGETDGYLLTELGNHILESWDPVADEVAGESCKAYGAGGIMRQPTRLKITWESNNVLKIETDAGMQTRLLKFNEAQDGAGKGTWQGVSNANWNLHLQGRGGPVDSGTLEVETHDMRQGYLLRNGIPYSDQTTMKEYFDIVTQEDGTQYLILLSVVEDPIFLSAPAITSSNFQREENDSQWDPLECLTQ